MVRVAIVGVSSAVAPAGDGRSDAEILAPVVDAALESAGIRPSELSVIGTASSEFLNGVVGSVMGAFDALPCWPPRTHVHLEADGAFALYECWARLRAGDGDTALVCAFSRPIAAERRAVLRLQLDPYLVDPLGIDPVAIAALQAQAMVEGGRCTEEDVVAVTGARRGMAVAELVRHPYVARPLRVLDCSTVCAGAVAVVLATGDRVPSDHTPAAWIIGMDTRIEPGALGDRDLTVSSSTRWAADRLGLRGLAMDVVELHAPFSHQELVLEHAVGLAGIGARNPSGGALVADPIMATGLLRIGHAAQSILGGRARRALGHATNGPCLQQNLLCHLERA